MEWGCEMEYGAEENDCEMASGAAAEEADGGGRGPSAGGYESWALVAALKARGGGASPSPILSAACDATREATSARWASHSADVDETSRM